MNRKIIKIIKWFLLLSLIFSSIFLFNYSYFKENNGIFFLNALDSANGKISYIGFDVHSIDWVFFQYSEPIIWRKDRDYGFGRWFGLLKCYYQYKVPYTDPVYFDNGKRESCWVDFWYLNLEDCPLHPNGKPFFRSNSVIVFYYVLTPDDYKIIESFQNTKRIPYLKSIALEIKTMPHFIKSELNYITRDDLIPLEIPIAVLTVLFSIPYIYFQVIVPSSLSIPFFWLWIGFSIFYIITPYKVLRQIGEKVKGIFHRHTKGEA